MFILYFTWGLRIAALNVHAFNMFICTFKLLSKKKTQFTLLTSRRGCHCPESSKQACLSYAYYSTYWFFLWILNNCLCFMGINPLSVMHDDAKFYSGLLLVFYLHLWIILPCKNFTLLCSEICNSFFFVMASEFNDLNKKAFYSPRL